MMRIIRILIVCVLFVLVVKLVFADEDDGIVVYPDGSFGVDIGGGYQAMPTRGSDRYESLPAQPYREPYRNTQYGAQLGDGFVSTFPEFSFKKGGEVPEKIEEEEEMTDYIFHAYTTSPDVSPLWGFSEPSGTGENHQKGD